MWNWRHESFDLFTTRPSHNAELRRSCRHVTERPTVCRLAIWCEVRTLLKSAQAAASIRDCYFALRLIGASRLSVSTLLSLAAREPVFNVSHSRAFWGFSLASRGMVTDGVKSDVDWIEWLTPPRQISCPSVQWWMHNSKTEKKISTEFRNNVYTL